MARARSPNRGEAERIYLECNGDISNKELAERLGEKISNINTWKSKDGWKKKLKHRGAPLGNQNAKGNKGGGAPKGNINSYKFGMYSDRLPPAVFKIMEEVDTEDPIEKLWSNICLLEARIIHMQKIMHVQSNKSHSKLISGYGKNSVTYKIQYAHDKEANLVATHAKAVATLSSMIERYEKMVHANHDLETEERKLRIEALKVKIEKAKNTEGDSTQGFEDEFSELIE